MNVVLWVVIGGVVGAVSLFGLKLNVGRGLVLSVSLGVIAAFFGGHMLASLLGVPPSATDEFNPFALLVAAATALACLALSDMASKRFGV
jgi:uncharacterized membrane protein YeaQ/YmgE (transglycosylase-associated protein family)